LYDLVPAVEFENRMLRRVLEPKREEVAGGSRKLYKEDFHNLYASPNIIRVLMSRRMRWVGIVARMGQMRKAHKILVGTPEGKRPLGRPRRRW
jgi:hypothetical protein